MKTSVWLLVIALLAIVPVEIGYCPFLTNCGEKTSAADKPINSVYESITRSFHWSTTKHNSNWCVIKFSASSKVQIEEMYLNFSFECEKHRVDWCGYAITNQTWSDIGGVISETLCQDERFFHIDIGPFNYTYDTRQWHNKTKKREMWRGGFSLSAGTWYLICYVGETIESAIEIRLNTTNSIKLLGIREGEGTSVLLPEDFLGSINLKVGTKIVGVFNGEKSVAINNTFLGIHYSTFSSWGFENWGYSTPNGSSENFRTVFAGNKKIAVDTEPECIIGAGGVWTLRLNMFLFGNILTDRYLCPGFGSSIFVADIQLPRE